jgi:SAM-dependent methyltransferase
MGLNYYVAREVLAARADSGIASVATMGRFQHFLLPTQIESLRNRFGLSDGGWTRQGFGDYEAGFFTSAGASDVVVVDVSPYEGADLIHDLNAPIAPDLEQRFDQVVDGGTLEHLFRPDQALANMMRMVRVGGSLTVWTPANNLCGHGFYQFSPEFFFSAFSTERGFRVETLLLVECIYPSVSLVPPRAAYSVRSPREARTRVQVMSRRPLMLLVRGVKLRHLAQPFAEAPQQSDYEAQWRKGTGATHWAPRVPAALASMTTRITELVRNGRLTAPIVRRALGIRERSRFSLRNRAFFARERRD